MRTVVKVLILYINTADVHHVLILTRALHIKNSPGLDDLPGGKLEPDELPEAGIIREVHEETNLCIDQPTHATTYYWKDVDSVDIEEYLFYAFVTTQEVIIDVNEHSSFRWIPLTTIAESTLHPNLKKIIEQLKL